MSAMSTHTLRSIDQCNPHSLLILFLIIIIIVRITDVRGILPSRHGRDHLLMHSSVLVSLAERGDAPQVRDDVFGFTEVDLLCAHVSIEVCLSRNVGGEAYAASSAS